MASNQEYKNVIASSFGKTVNKELCLISKPFENTGVVIFRVYHDKKVVGEFKGYEPEEAVKCYNAI
jgi:hypothetical protein